MEKTDGEKWDFLEALYKHGVDVEKLSTLVPTWTISQIEQIIQRFRSRAKRKLEEEEKPAAKTAALNQWVKVTENLHQLQGSTNQPWWRKGRRKLNEEPKDHSPILSKTLLYAACFEDHYHGTAPDDPNYSEIYRYLSQLVEGIEPTQLSPASAGKVLEMLNKIKKIVTDDSALPNVQYLQNLNLSYLPKKNESKKRKRKASMKSETDDIRTEAGSPLPSCPLFQDEVEEATVVPLKPGDPYYEHNREEMVKKIQMQQQQEAWTINLVPGLNPMEIPDKLLVKPGNSIIETQHL